MEKISTLTALAVLLLSACSLQPVKNMGGQVSNVISKETPPNVVIILHQLNNLATAML